MKSICALSLSLLVILSVLPLATRASTQAQFFVIPDGRVSEAYHAEIEAILRGKYGLKIDTGVQASILQWQLLGGELPPGLIVRTDGTIVGTPKVAREQAYHFRVGVNDLSVSGSERLILELSMLVSGPRIRLTKISGPVLTPVEASATQPTSGSTSAEAAPAVKNHSTVIISAGSDQSANSKRSSAAKVNTSSTLNTASTPTDASASRSAIDTANKSSSARPVTTLRTRERGLFSRMAGVFGLVRDEGAATQRGDAAGLGEDGNSPCPSGSNRVTSDEAHNSLEGDDRTRSTCVKFKNLNTLRYKIDYNGKTTRTEGPDITKLPFLPTFSSAATAPISRADTTTPTTGNLISIFNGRAANIKALPAGERAKVEKIPTEMEKLDQRLNAIFDGLNEEDANIRANVETGANQVTTEVKNAHEASLQLARNADDFLQSNNADGLVTQVHTVLEDVVNEALKRDWPTSEINTSLNNLGNLSTRLEKLRDEDNGVSDPVERETWTLWLKDNQDRLNQARTRIGELRGKVNTVAAGAEAFNTSKNVLKEWQNILTNVDKQGISAFDQESYVSCHTDENEIQTSKLSISKTDRLNPGQTPTSREVLTVHCYSRVAITGGLNFSSLNEREFSVVQSAGTSPGTVVKKFGFTNKSSFRPNPLILLNVRLTDNPVYNWHASFGAVVDLKGQTGTDLEPVGGVSFSIRRVIFITPFAVHIGRETGLAGGFKVGDLVPDTVATPPLEKSWKLGYTAGVTFRLAP